MPAPRQFILPFSHPPQFAAEDFVASPSNAEALAWLDRPHDWPQSRLVLSGPEGCGKTHLLHVWAARHGAEILSALAPADPFAPLRAAALAIDDADEMAEVPLFHLLNQAAAAATSVLLTARRPPARWAFHLPDLASRLRACAHVAIEPADDELLNTLLARLASDRQMILPPGVAEFLLARLPRTSAALREAVARLDRAAMARGIRPSRALAAEIIGQIIAEISGEDHEPTPGCHENDNPMIFDVIRAEPLYPQPKPVRSHP